MDILLVLLVIGVAVYLYQRQAAGTRERALGERRAADLAAVRKVAEEDVTRFGEELQRLDTEVLTTSLDEAARQDYQRALDSYESAKESLGRSPAPRTIPHVTEQLEDGRYAVACVLARAEGSRCRRDGRRASSTRPTARRPPTSSGRPQAGSSARSRSAPPTPTGSPRAPSPTSAPCRQGAGRVPYWQGGPAYSPWASGYFGGYADVRPAAGVPARLDAHRRLGRRRLGRRLRLRRRRLRRRRDGGDAGDGGDSGGDGGGDAGGDGGLRRRCGDGGGFDFGGGDFGGFDF